VAKKHSSVEKLLAGHSPDSYPFKLRLWRYLQIDRMLDIFEDKKSMPAVKYIAVNQNDSSSLVFPAHR
jgi:hypothetical protein